MASGAWPSSRSLYANYWMATPFGLAMAIELPKLSCRVGLNKNIWVDSSHLAIAFFIGN